MPSNWPRRAEVLLRVYSQEVGPLPDDLRSFLEQAAAMPPKLSRAALFAFKYAYLAAVEIGKANDAALTQGEDDPFIVRRKQRNIVEMLRRLEVLRAEVS